MTINSLVRQRTYVVENEKPMRPLAARASRPSAEPATSSPSSASPSAPSSAPSSAPPSATSNCSALSSALVSSSSQRSSSMTSVPMSSPSAVSFAHMAPSSSLSVEADEKGENDDDDDDEMLRPMTDSEWDCWTPRPPSADQVNDAHELVVRRRKKLAQLPRPSASTPQRRQRATSIIRAFLLKRVQLKTGKQKLTHAQQALTFDDAAPWRSVHNRTCLGLHLRRFVADEVTQDAVMPEVLADTAVAMLCDFRRALEREDDDELACLHVLMQPAFRSWVLNRIYQMYVS